MDHTGQENIWFVGCSTTARATPAPGESAKLWFVLELMHDEQTDPSMYHSTDGLVRSSQALSRTNENFRLRVRFRFRPAT